MLIFAYVKKQSGNDMSALFDNKPSEITGDTQNDTTTSAPSDTATDTQPAGESTDGTPDADSTEQPPQPTEYKHSQAEIGTIINRYIEAENFYYTMLYQRYDLDGYDIITKENPDGYNTQYHRVLYYDINSTAELKDCYRRYFTEDFVARVDFNSYIEENGKLYCAQTENSAGQQGVKYLYTVESISENTANIIRTRTDGTSMQKVGAEKIGGEWYFGGVAIG